MPASERKRKTPQNGVENSVFPSATMGNFKSAALDLREGDLSLGNFEPTEKKRTDAEN